MSKSRLIPYGRQWIDEADVAAITNAIGSDFLTTGPGVEDFERALANYCGAEHAVAVANGTAALHLAMLAAGIGPGQRVLTSANTFLASANCAEFVGAAADFADIDPHSYNVTTGTLAAAWKEDVRAVVPVDFAGQPCDLPAIAALARERGALIIEDACHALGSHFEHEGSTWRVGGHPWADMTCFSFHAVKTITTGEGGAILTNDERLAHQCRLLRSHGMVRRPEEGPWFYEMAELGYNYRLTDVQCALGVSQLRKLDGFVRRRAEIVAAYNAAFAALPLLKTPQPSIRNPQSSIAWHLYVLQFDFAALGKTRTQVMAGLRERGIGTQVHYIPVHLQPYYRRKYGYGPGKCPAAEAYYQRCLSLPLFPAMTDADVARVIRAIQEVTGA